MKYTVELTDSQKERLEDILHAASFQLQLLPQEEAKINLQVDIDNPMKATDTFYDATNQTLTVVCPACNYKNTYKGLFLAGKYHKKCRNCKQHIVF